MSTVTTLRRADAEQERSELLERLGTEDRDALREALFSGYLGAEAAAAVERLSALDYLLDGD